MATLNLHSVKEKSMAEIVIEIDPEYADVIRNAIEKGVIPLVGWGGGSGISFGTGGRGGE